MIEFCSIPQLAGPDTVRLTNSGMTVWIYLKLDRLLSYVQSSISATISVGNEVTFDITAKPMNLR